jgi:hypothetical protein
MFTSVIDRLSEMRETYVLRHDLHRDLAAITSEDALVDLEAAIARCESVQADWQTQEMRRALTAHRSVITR